MNFNSYIETIKENFSQFFILNRHFINRLFKNDYIIFEEEMKAKTISMLVILALLLGFISHRILFWYWLVEDNNLSWVEKCYMMSLFMAIMGFITVLMWENLFLDSRDYSNLVLLPIRIRTLLSAKFASLCLFIGIFAFGANLFSALTFSWYLPKYQSNSFIFGIQFFFAHLFSFALASFFIFFLVYFFLGLLKSALGFRLFRRLSVYIKSILLIGFAFLIVQIITRSTSMSFHFNLLFGARNNNHSFGYFFPPMWFTGIYEFLLNNKDPYFEAMASIAILVFVLSFFACIFALGFNFKLHLFRKEEFNSQILCLNRARKTFFNILNSIFLRNPIQRAIFHFFRLSIKGSNLHKIRLAVFISISIGILLILMVYQGNSPLESPAANKVLLMAPLILSFFLLIGIKSVIKIPAFLDSNWIFKITEIEKKQHYFLGLRKGIFIVLLVPLHSILFVFYLFSWGMMVSFYHFLFGLVMSFIFMEVLFFKSRKIPFTCSYLPGQEKLYNFWIIYFIGFLIYVLSLSWIELKLLAKPNRFIMFYGFVFLIYICMLVIKKYKIDKDIVIIYEEEPPSVMLIFDLGE